VVANNTPKAPVTHTPDLTPDLNKYKRRAALLEELLLEPLDGFVPVGGRNVAGHCVGKHAAAMRTTAENGGKLDSCKRACEEKGASCLAYETNLNRNACYLYSTDTEECAAKGCENRVPTGAKIPYRMHIRALDDAGALTVRDGSSFYGSYSEWQDTFGVELSPTKATKHNVQHCRNNSKVGAGEVLLFRSTETTIRGNYTDETGAAWRDGDTLIKPDQSCAEDSGDSEHARDAQCFVRRGTWANDKCFWGIDDDRGTLGKHSYSATENGLAECQQLCDADEECSGLTYVPDGSTNSLLCLLRKGHGSLKSCPGIRAYKKDAPAFHREDSCTVHKPLFESPKTGYTRVNLEEIEYKKLVERAAAKCGAIPDAKYVSVFDDSSFKCYADCTAAQPDSVPSVSKIKPSARTFRLQ